MDSLIDIVFSNTPLMSTAFFHQVRIDLHVENPQQYPMFAKAFPRPFYTPSEKVISTLSIAVVFSLPEPFSVFVDETKWDFLWDQTDEYGVTLSLYRAPGVGLAYRFENIADIYYFENLDKAVAYVHERDISRLPKGLRRFVITPVMFEHMRKNRMYPLHCAALCKGENAAVFIGDAEAGKSTLTFALVSQGFEAVSDDMVFIDNNPQAPRILSTSDEFSVCLDPQIRFPQIETLLDYDHPSGVDKVMFCVEDYFPGSYRQAAIPKALFFLSRSGHEKFTLNPVNAAGAMGLILSQSVYFTDPEISERHVDALVELTATLPCYHLDLGADYPHGINELVRHLNDILI